MPQDIPFEASETLAFIPPSLAGMKNAPAFTLRSPTSRDKRFHRRLIRESGVTRHTKEEFRAEVLTGLEKLWGPETFAQHKPVIEQYWEAIDQYELQAKDDPDLEWSYDPEIERAVDDLTERVTKAWEPLRVMAADNADAAEMAPVLIAAIAIESWSGLKTEARLDRGYLHPDCLEAVRDELETIEKKQKAKSSGTAWVELMVACTQRLYLDEEEEKNSASPSPSETTPPTSKSGAASKPGSSPASASSTKTPENA